jgi:hypothetical protein
MNLLIDLHRRIHITSAGNTDPTAAIVKTRQKPKVSITFTDAALADTTTTAVTLALKVTKTSATTASTVTLARVSASLVYQGYLDLTTDIITALTDGQDVYMECSWVLDTDKPQRTDDATLKIQRSIITGTEGEPDPEQSTADRLTWLTSYILAGEGITIDEDPDTGAITLNASASGSSAWADITGKPSTFPPDAHTQAISTITGLQTALDGKADDGHTHTKSEVGLANVDNTADADKPVSTAQAAAIVTALANFLANANTFTAQQLFNAASATGAIRLSPVWNSAGTTFNGIYVRVTDTASGFASNLLDIGTTSSLLRLQKNGDFFCPGGIEMGGGAVNQTRMSPHSGGVLFNANGVFVTKITSTEVRLPANQALIFTDTNNNAYSATTRNGVYSGTVSPESSVTAGPGSIYLRNNSGTGELWLKTSGTGNTGWVQK